MALYEMLCGCTSHPTAEDLFHMVQPRVGRLSRATVYNTLEALCSAGLVLRLPTTNGCARYDADTTEHVHVRIADTSDIRDVPPALGRRLLDGLPRDVLREIEARMGVRIEGMNIQLVGRAMARSHSDDAARARL